MKLFLLLALPLGLARAADDVDCDSGTESLFEIEFVDRATNFKPFEWDLTYPTQNKITVVHHEDYVYIGHVPPSKKHCFPKNECVVFQTDREPGKFTVRVDGTDLDPQDYDTFPSKDVRGEQVGTVSTIELGNEDVCKPTCDSNEGLFEFSVFAGTFRVGGTLGEEIAWRLEDTATGTVLAECETTKMDEFSRTYCDYDFNHLYHTRKCLLKDGCYRVVAGSAPSLEPMRSSWKARFDEKTAMKPIGDFRFEAFEFGNCLQGCDASKDSVLEFFAWRDESDDETAQVDYYVKKNEETLFETVVEPARTPQMFYARVCVPKDTCLTFEAMFSTSASAKETFHQLSLDDVLYIKQQAAHGVEGSIMIGSCDTEVCSFGESSLLDLKITTGQDLPALIWEVEAEDGTVIKSSDRFRMSAFSEPDRIFHTYQCIPDSDECVEFRLESSPEDGDTTSYKLILEGEVLEDRMICLAGEQCPTANETLGTPLNAHCDDDLSDEGLAGIIVGSIAGMALVAGIGYFFFRASHKKTEAPKPAPPEAAMKEVGQEEPTSGVEDHTGEDEP